MTQGDGQKLYFKEEAKINEMAIGQNLFPITLDLKNTPESQPKQREEAHMRHPLTHPHMLPSGFFTLTSPIGAGRQCNHQRISEQMSSSILRI